MKNNKTFIGGNPTWGNACVGNNGYPSYLEYGRGYSESANLLIDTVLKDRLTVDIYIYPICFNMRHSVELRLKGLITDLERFKDFREKLPSFDLESSHDLGKIWSYIKNQIIRLDSRYEKFISKLDSYILDIAMVDSTGQVFRYPMSNENNKHLVEVNTISLHTLQKRFKELEKLLDDFHYFTELILEEYQQKTFTKKLSRLNIFNLARQLPLKIDWQVELDKKKLKDLFNISGRELSDTLNMIQVHYELSQYIGIYKKLKYISIDELFVFFDIWIQIHKDKPISQSIIFSNKDDMVTVIEEIKRIEEVLSSTSTKFKAIDINSLIEIRTLFYFGIDNRYSTAYSEEYTSSLEYEIKEGLYSDKDEFNHILKKPNAFENILASLYFLGQYAIADAIRKKYKKIYTLNIESVNCNGLFSKNKLLGYKNIVIS